MGSFAAICLLIGACASQPKDAPMKLGPPPAYASIAARYNKRCADLDRLKATVTIIVDTPDGKGGRRKDQVEAYLQLILPTRFSLRVDKVGKTLAILGSDERRFWWIDTDARVARVGEHAHAATNRAAAAEFGIPILPSDLIELLAITPLPLNEQAAGLKTVRADSGDVIIELPPSSPGESARRLYIDEATAFPTRVEVFDTARAVILQAALTRPVQVKVLDNSFSPAFVASRYEILIPSTDTRVTVSIASPENPREEMRLKPFDLDTLLEAYGVEDISPLSPGGR